MGDKIKKLSDAIRLGATFRPQCQSQYFYAGKSCAIGAAIEALGLRGLSEFDAETELFKRFNVAPWGEGEKMWKKISGMNDSGQTRESIADWLEAQGL